jgi:hypothetical protein
VDKNNSFETPFLNSDSFRSKKGIRVPPIKKWPGYAFTFHCWLKLRSDAESFSKQRRQLYSFYNDQGQGFEAFFTSDCSSLVVSVCTKKEFLSVQLRELDFDASQSINTSANSADHFNSDNVTTNNTSLKGNGVQHTKKANSYTKNMTK